MKKYKVEFEVKTGYIVDVLAKDEGEAIDKANEKFIEIENAGMIHYHEKGDSVRELFCIYDVTGTDDPFNP